MPSIVKPHLQALKVNAIGLLSGISLISSFKSTQNHREETISIADKKDVKYPMV